MRKRATKVARLGVLLMAGFAMVDCGGALRERPNDVLAHERGRVLKPSLERPDDRARVGRGRELRQRIAQADREIARPAIVTDAVDRAAGEALVKSLGRCRRR